MQPVAGLFDHFENANQAVLSLEEAGLDKDRISILARKKTVPQDLELKRPAKGVAASAGTGAAAGGVIGGLLAILAGLGAVLIPGLGPVLAVGALSTGLGVVAGGAGVGAAVGGF